MTVSRTERLLKMGFFKDEAALLAFSEELQELSDDKARFDLKWKYGIDEARVVE